MAADSLHIYRDGGFLCIARIQVDHNEDYIAGGWIRLRIGNYGFIVGVMEPQGAQLLQSGIIAADLVEQPDIGLEGIS